MYTHQDLQNHKITHNHRQTDRRTHAHTIKLAHAHMPWTIGRKARRSSMTLHYRYVLDINESFLAVVSPVIDVVSYIARLISGKKNVGVART